MLTRPSKGTEVITAEDPANPGVLTLIADDALTLDEKDEYLEKQNLPDARPSTDYEGAEWKTDWLPGVLPIPFYYYPVTGSEPTPPPKLRGSWSGFYHSLTEEIDAGVQVETGVRVHNDRLASLPPLPLPPLPEGSVTRYAGAFTADGEYTFTDLPYGHLGTGGQTTSTTFDANAWLTIDTASLDETTRLLYSPTTGPYTATTDGKYGNRAAFWIKTDNGAPAGAAITRTYLKVTTTLASSGGTPPNPVTETVTLTIPKGKKSSAITSLVAAQGKMVSLLPWEFRARDQFSDSFDPPLIGDIHPPTGAKDKDDWVAWTSVARIGGYNTNNRTKLVFPSDSEASMFDLAVAADSLQFITVQPTHLTTKETNLTIHGLPGNVIEMASIELRQKGTTNVVGRLRVMALPERNTISCTFYRVHEPNEDPANILRPGFYPVPTVNSPVAGPGTATGEIDDRMAQAVVSASTTSPIIEMTVDYEPNNGGNGILDTDAEFEVFRRKRQQGLFNGSCNVIYVPFLDTVEGELAVVVSPASKLVFIAQNEWVASGTAQPDAKLLAPEDAKGVSWQMDRVIAHEFGHYLEISTRQAGTVTPTGGHDDGMHPPGTAPLMRSGPAGGSGRWMRHEDWEMANRRAKDRLQ